MKSTRLNLNIKDKCDIIRKLENEGASVNELAQEYNVNRTTIYRIKVNKQKIEEFLLKHPGALKHSKRIKEVKVPNIDRALHLWFLSQRSTRNKVTNEILRRKALELHKTLNVDVPFEASSGFLEKFKRRYGIRLLREKHSPKESRVSECIEDFLIKVRELELSPEQVYNAAETGLIYKSLHDRTLVEYDETNVGERNNLKERLTIMPCVNASGSHQLPLMIIGESKNPRCFSGSVLPHMYYRSSKNSTQTSLLFKEWFFKEFVPQVSNHLKSQNLPPKAILLLDSASCHGNGNMLSTEDGNIAVYFFPPKATSILQPMDQNIIKCLKQNYRHKLLLELISMDGDDIHAKLLKINLKDICFLTTEAWSQMKRSVIVSGWGKIFKPEDIKENFDAEDDIPIQVLYRIATQSSICTDAEILDWAEGTNEDSTEVIEEDTNARTGMDEEDDDCTASIDSVIMGLNDAIKWAESAKLSLTEILLLRKIRQKAVQQKIACYI